MSDHKTYQMGIDLGGTKIEGIVLDENNLELIRHRIPTEQEKGYEHILDNIKSLRDFLASKINNNNYTIGVGAPGSVSRQTGAIKNSNTLCLNKMPLKTDLESLLNHKICIENDANCFAMAEANFGAGAGSDMVFGVIMGTGCGGGIVYKGEVIRGRHDIAGEWGHTSIDPEGPDCYCGSKGCVETFISGGGLERAYEKKCGKRLRLPEIVELHRKGDKGAGEFMRAFFRNFGRATANLINVLDPDIIALGGGVSNIDELYTNGVEETKKMVFNDNFSAPIVRNKLGDSAGVIGAALIGK